MVAMNVFGTVMTTSPGPIPAAIRANRKRIGAAADTDAIAATSQNSAKSRSNSSTIGPPMNPAVSKAVSENVDAAPLSAPRCGVTRSRNGISFVSTHHCRSCTLLVQSFATLGPDFPPRSHWREHLWSLRCRRPQWPFSPIVTLRQDRGARPDRSALLDQRRLDFPVLLRSAAAHRQWSPAGSVSLMNVTP